MFIGVKELERHKLTLREEFVPGTIDFRTRDFRQVAPLSVDLEAELEGAEIHIVGRLATRVELTCARCLEPVEREMAPRFDLVYRPVAAISREERFDFRSPSRATVEGEIGPTPEDLGVGFYVDDGLFLADVVAEQVHLALPMKVVCREDCRGLCPGCGVNLNRERCRCRAPAVDPRLAPLAEWAARKKKPE
ncbi:MAG: DUF177 domain-containing protein [Acidobacteria bacterium]|nr:DUF177 domain-containing protein [Acidobacteriota bacterium]